MTQTFYESLLIKGATSLASTFGNKIGGAIAREILTQFGIQEDRFKEVLGKLDAVQDHLDRMEAMLTQIQTQLSWLHSDAVFSEFQTDVESILRRVFVIRDDHGNSGNEELIKLRKLMDEPASQSLENKLTGFHRMYMGTDKAIEVGKSLPATMFETRWALFGSDARTTTLGQATDTALAIYMRLAEYQLKAAMLVWLRHALQDPAEEAQARSIVDTVLTNLHEQYRELVARAPSLMAYVLSGYPLGGTGANWNVLVKSTVPNLKEHWFVPYPGVYVPGPYGDVMSSLLSDKSEEINLVPDTKRPGRFLMRSLKDLNSWLGFKTKSVMTFPGTDQIVHTSQNFSGDGPGLNTAANVVPGTPPRYAHVLAAVFESTGPDDAHVSELMLCTSETRDSYLVMDQNGMLMTVVSYDNDPGLVVGAFTGGREMHHTHVVCVPDVAASDARKNATLWDIRLSPSTEGFLDYVKSDNLI